MPRCKACNSANMTISREYYTKNKDLRVIRVRIWRCQAKLGKRQVACDHLQREEV